MTGDTEFVDVYLMLKHSPENGLIEPAEIISMPSWFVFPKLPSTITFVSTIDNRVPPVASSSNSIRGNWLISQAESAKCSILALLIRYISCSPLPKLVIRRSPDN